MHPQSKQNKARSSERVSSRYVVTTKKKKYFSKKKKAKSKKKERRQKKQKKKRRQSQPPNSQATTTRIGFKNLLQFGAKFPLFCFLHLENVCILSQRLKMHR
jgi:hypothetical protein